MSSALKQVEEIVDRLSPDERVELLKYLAPRLSVSASPTPKAGHADAIAAWNRMKELGREMAGEPGTGKSAGEILSEMRG